VKFEVMTAVTMQINPVGCDHDGCIPLLHSPSQLSMQSVTHRNKCIADVALRFLVDMY
jgi:hypothetical protein